MGGDFLSVQVRFDSDKPELFTNLRIFLPAIWQVFRFFFGIMQDVLDPVLSDTGSCSF